MIVRRRRLIAAFLTVAAALAGCTVFRSDEIVADGDLGPDGMIYYLPKTLVTLTVMPWGRKGDSASGREDRVDYVELTLPASKDAAVAPVLPVEHVPDMARQYVLNYTPNAFSTDHICAGGQDGLLYAVEASAADETGNIFVSIAKLAGRLAAPSPFATPERESEADIVPLTDRQFTMSIDPLDQADRDALAETIKRRFKSLANKDYRLAVEGEDLLRGNGAAPCPADSVCYRTTVRTRLALTDKNNRHASFAYAPIINRSVTGHIDVSRAFMVEKITRLTFNKGVLVSVAIKKPSEALAVAKLPLSVVDAVMTSFLAAPGNFLANASGLPADQHIKLVQDSATNAEKIAVLQDKLEDVRNGDDVISGRYSDFADDKALYKIRCNKGT